MRPAWPFGLLGWLAVPLLASAATVEVIAAKDPPICERLAKLIGARLTFDAEALKMVEWNPVELSGQGPKTTRCSGIEKAVFDIDNDGREDLVVKTTFCMKGAPSDSLYVFPHESPVLEQATWQDLSPLLATPDRFERTGGTYPLVSLEAERGLPPLTTSFSIQPVILDHVAYISLTDGRREWMVLAKYARGERFEDQCYVKRVRQ
jgi:hypothetical protein